MQLVIHFNLICWSLMWMKLPGEAKQNILPPECGQPIDGVFTDAFILFIRNISPFLCNPWNSMGISHGLVGVHDKYRSQVNYILKLRSTITYYTFCPTVQSSSTSTGDYS
jgi:hypothetical protein